MAFLVDTSVWIDWLRGTDTPESDWLAKAIIQDAEIVVPGLVLTEILRGLTSPRDVSRLERLLAQFNPPPQLEEPDYPAAALLYRQCRAQGITIASTADCLIGQLAIRHRLLLVTRDRDFEGMARLTGLGLFRPKAH